jgi:hypothetical protein
MTSLRLIVAQSAQHLAHAEQLRLAVYCEEEGMFAAPAEPAEQLDTRELGSDLTQLLVYAGQEPVGTVRLSLARGANSDSSEPRGLELESKFALFGFERPGVVLGEISHYCVRARFRGTRVAPALFAALGVESQRRGVTHWVAAANVDTDCAEDAALAYRLLVARNWVSTMYRAEARVHELPPTTARRSLYTQEQRAHARCGQLSRLKLPRALALFAHKMGARYIGPPTFDRRFNVFAAPLAVDLAKAAATRAPARALSGLLDPRVGAAL